jgi:hypothetical protein
MHRKITPTLASIAISAMGLKVPARLCIFGDAMLFVPSSSISGVPSSTTVSMAIRSVKNDRVYEARNVMITSSLESSSCEFAIAK